MNRIAGTVLVFCIWFASAVSAANAPSSLVNGIYLVTVEGTANGVGSVGPEGAFTLLGVLVVYPSTTDERAAEMCLFINGNPTEDPTPASAIGASWFASRLGCGAAAGGRGASTSLIDARVGGVHLVQVEAYEALIATAPSADQAEESASARENTFVARLNTMQQDVCLAGCDRRTASLIPVSAGWWTVVTVDRGHSIGGLVWVEGTDELNHPAKYRATFYGKLIARMR